MPHRDPLVAAQARIEALERELAERVARVGETVPTAIARLEEEKRALAAERTRLVIERDQLTDDLGRARAALARAEEEAVALRREAVGARAIRDQLRRQAIDESTRSAQRRREESIAPAGSRPPPKPR